MKVKINLVKTSESNPRVIRDEKFQKLIKSIKEFPEMMEIRTIVVDESMTVLGGNMRLNACREAGLKEVDVTVLTDDKIDQIIDKRAQELGIDLNDKKIDQILKDSRLTRQDIKNEFVVKDNVSFGEWDWDALANTWDNDSLAGWGLDVWQPNKSQEFDPNLMPEQAGNMITKNDINKIDLETNIRKGTEQTFHDVMCPECGNEFKIEIQRTN